MGEIADALRRAKAEKDGQDDTARADGNATAPVRRTAGFREAVGARPSAGRTPTGVREAVDEALRTTLPDAPWGEDTPLVSLIDAKGGDPHARSLLEQEASAMSQSYRHFALRLGRVLADRGRSVMVTSCLPREGKTTTACNLAMALASLAPEHRVALLDLDLRKPSAARALGVEARVGVETVLSGKSPLASACIRTDVRGLDLYLASKPIRDVQTLLGGSRLSAMLQDLEQRYDRVVVDAPPVLLVPDVAQIASQVAGCIAVVRSGDTREAAFRQMVALLPPGRLLGVLLNMAPLPQHSREYGYYYGDAQAEPAGGSQ